MKLPNSILIRTRQRQYLRCRYVMTGSGMSKSGPIIGQVSLLCAWPINVFLRPELALNVGVVLLHWYWHSFGVICGGCVTPKMRIFRWRIYNNILPHARISTEGYLLSSLHALYARIVWRMLSMSSFSAS